MVYEYAFAIGKIGSNFLLASSMPRIVLLCTSQQLIVILSLEETRKKTFFEQPTTNSTVSKTINPIRRRNDLIALYSAFESLPLQEMNVEFEGEDGIDFGGLTKDLYEAF